MATSYCTVSCSTLLSRNASTVFEGITVPECKKSISRVASKVPAACAFEQTLLAHFVEKIIQFYGVFLQYFICAMVFTNAYKWSRLLANSKHNGTSCPRYTTEDFAGVPRPVCCCGRVTRESESV